MGRQHDQAHRRARHACAAPTEDAVVRRLQSLGAELTTTPAPDYRSATRARLVAMAAVRPAPHERIPGPALARRRSRAGGSSAARWRTLATAGLAGAALSVSTVGGLLAASQGTKPGDLLYGVKRGGERTQLVLAGDATRGRTLLELASTRLTELSELARDGAALPAAAGPAGDTAVLAAGGAAEVVVDTLATMDAQTSQGVWWVTTTSVASGETPELAALASWAADQEAGLAALGGAVPAAAASALAVSTELVAAVADRATGLAEALGCATGPATSGTDDLGPRPAPCPASGHRSVSGHGDGADTAGSPTADPATGGGVDQAADQATDQVADQAGREPARGGAVPAVPPPPDAAPPASSARPPVAVPPGAVDGGTSAPQPPRPAGGPPGVGGVPLPPLPAPPPGPSRGPSSPDVPPLVELPLPVCVTALGLPAPC